MKSTRLSSSNEKEPSLMGQAADVMRSISILYNNSRVYSIEHPVFKKTLFEHMPFFQETLLYQRKLAFSFFKGKILCGSLLLDPGSSIFQSFAHTMEGLGVSGFFICEGVTAEDITKLISILTSRASEVSKSGLQKVLDIERVEHISEHKISLSEDERIGQTTPDGVQNISGKHVLKTLTPSSGKTFELDDDNVADMETEFSRETTEKPGASDVSVDGSESQKPFKAFVTSALNNFTDKKADIMQIADQISNEFEEQLNNKTNGLRIEKETAVRRLENVKSIVFKKLDALNVMAILADTDLVIWALTLSAREFLGDIQSIPPESPLAECIRLQGAYMDIVLKGKSITVQTIASDRSRDGELILLLTLNS